MDQIQREKIAAKLKKIKALAERGVGGEKETAMRMYEDLKARYELEDEEIMLDAVTLQENNGPAPERTDEEKRMLKKAAWYSQVLDKRRPPRALIGEPEVEED